MLLFGAGLQLVLPTSTKLPPESELAPRRVRAPVQLAAQEYPAVLASPIFAPDRKSDETAVPVSGGMNGFAVLGIATAGETATALVRGPGGMVQRLKPGEMMAGWTLVAVQLDQLTFERDKERRVLMLSKVPLPMLAGRMRPPFGPRLNTGNANTNMSNNSNDDSDSDDDDDNDNDNN